ncbi:MAG: transposase [Myxococcota bacterium]
MDLHPFDLLAWLCALIPPPRFNMVRYHGVIEGQAEALAIGTPSHAGLVVRPADAAYHRHDDDTATSGELPHREPS